MLFAVPDALTSYGGAEGEVDPGICAPGLPPNLLPDCASGQNEDLSVGNGDVAKEQYLVDCSEGADDDTGPLGARVQGFSRLSG